jgi:excisionase family DNA binding protein
MKTEEVLTSNEAIKYLKTSKKTLFKMVQEGKIKGNKLGRNYRFLKEELDNFLRGGENEN